jgi:hypothetical protein
MGEWLLSRRDEDILREEALIKLALMRLPRTGGSRVALRATPPQISRLTRSPCPRPLAS